MAVADALRAPTLRRGDNTSTTRAANLYVFLINHQGTRPDYMIEMRVVKTSP